MRRRDLGWRVAGAILLAIGSLPGLIVGLERPAGALAAADIATLLGAVVGLAGLVLLVSGRHTVRALRIEISPHRHLPFAIQEQRRRIGRHRRRARS